MRPSSAAVPPGTRNVTRAQPGRPYSMHSANTGTSIRRSSVSWLAAVRTDISRLSSGKLPNARNGCHDFLSGHGTAGPEPARVAHLHGFGRPGGRDRRVRDVPGGYVAQARPGGPPSTDLIGATRSDQVQELRNDLGDIASADRRVRLERMVREDVHDPGLRDRKNPRRGPVRGDGGDDHRRLVG